MRFLLPFLAVLCANFSFGQNSSIVPGELLVQLSEQSNPQLFIRQLEHDHKLGISDFICISEPVNVYHIKFNNTSINLDKCKALFSSYDEVTIVQKNHYIEERETIPTDEFFGNQWHLKNTGAEGGTEDADIDATDAWDTTTGGITAHGDTIVVCIIEPGGVDRFHPDLIDNMWKNHGEIPDDGIDNDGNGYIDDFDGWNISNETDNIGGGAHGSRVAGMIGAKGNNDFGSSGINWDIKMMVVSGVSSGDEASVIASYTYPMIMRKRYNESFGEEGAFVVATKSSWGVDGESDEEHPLWCAMYDSLGAYGVLNIGATTNDNRNVEEHGDMPTNCTSDYLIGVTMTNRTDLRFGVGYGAVSVDLGAPGQEIRNLTTSGGGYSSSVTGTSYAAPAVTGAVGLVYSTDCPSFMNIVKSDPAAGALLMRQYMLDGVDIVPALSGEVVTGGRLNVNNSILELLEDCDESGCYTPHSLRAENITDTSATIAWGGVSDDYVLTIKEVGNPANTVSITGSELHIDTLKPCTTYEISVLSQCGLDEFSTPTPIRTFETDGCCKNPVVRNIAKTEESLTVSWDEVLNGTSYNLRYSILDSADWTEVTDVTAPIEITGLLRCKEYEFQINTICTDSTRGYSESYVHRTLGCGACTEMEYCDPFGGNTLFEWIDSIAINTYSGGSGDNNGLFVSEQIITPLTPGESYTIRIKPGYAGTSFTLNYSIYIDFDHNGNFDWSNEVVVDDLSAAGLAFALIDIPSSATIGVTKMRVAMRGLGSGLPIDCPTNDFYGEYEDYCVYIGPQLGLDEIENNLSLYPNPVKNELYLSADQPIEEVQIFSTDGKLVYQQTGFKDESIETTTFGDGMYIVKVKTGQSILTKKFVKG